MGWIKGQPAQVGRRGAAAHLYMGLLAGVIGLELPAPEWGRGPPGGRPLWAATLALSRLSLADALPLLGGWEVCPPPWGSWSLLSSAPRRGM
jgi:hypothetical protein